MPQSFRFGIIGGYGSTGRVVAAELCKSGCPRILVGGRDFAKGKALAAEFDGRVTAAQVDVLNDNSLERFCRQCSIIVNCAGPVMHLQDRVAQAAFRARCHYLDLAGLAFVKDRMFPRQQDLVDADLSFVVSSGWLPGLSEVFPVYAHERARLQMDAIESVTVYFGDSGAWSTTAYEDMAWHLRYYGFRAPGYFHKGAWVRVKMLGASPKVDLGSPVGRHWFNLVSMPELEAVSQLLADCDFFSYAYLPSLRVALTAALGMLIPLPHRWSVRLLQRAFRKSCLPVGGFIVAQVLGQSQGRKCRLTARLVYDKHRDSWINGLAIATAARLVSEGKTIRAGAHYLVEAVDPLKFMGELRKGGVELTEEVTADD